GNTADVLRLAIPGRQARVERTYTPVELPPLPEREAVEWSAIDPGTRWVADLPGGVTSANGIAVGVWATMIAAAVRTTLSRGEQAIVVVPDYREQRQLHAALVDAVGEERIASLDARQSNADRARSFLLAGSGLATVTIGPRSTVYAPASKLGLIVIWDDGDPLHREPLAPYVHSRDAALQRQSLSGAALVFAAHARSTAVQRLEEIGYLETLDVPRTNRPRVIPADLVREQEGRIPSIAYGAIRSGLAEGPVLVQVAKPGFSTRLVCASCGDPVRCRHCTGPVRPRRRSNRNDSRADPACAWCGRGLGASTCEHCGGNRFDEAGSGSGRTAGELGRAFPGTTVTVADGEHEQLQVDARPRLVVATPGAAPLAVDGFRSVVLLDGASILMGERLSVVEDGMRQWRAALALAAPDATCIVTGASAELATALNQPSTAGFAAAQLAERRELGFPPAARVASVYGGSTEVARAVSSLDELPGVDTLGTVSVMGPQGQEEVRTIVRFTYAMGRDVAAALRAEVLRAATGRRKGSGRLRVKMDDMEPFEGAEGS
ncbi:MAG TPA: primosomal protein N', partial [Candidatus Agrococcus pullicola]|nr:primosomal protein N' [Candidatus Agrococcus pullicola]